MKITGLLFLILLFTINSFGQELNEKLIIDFFNQTFYDFFDTRDIKTDDFYILSDSIPQGIKTDFDGFEIHVIDYEQAYSLIEKDIISSLYWARFRQISVDTVDIVIGGWSVEYDRVAKNFNFAAWCRGTLGYVPQGRFIYLADIDEWTYIPEKTIIDSKMEEHRTE